MLRRVVAAHCGSVLLATLPAEAQTREPTVWLEVRRAPGSEDCPDADRVLATARSLFAEQPLVSAGSAEQAGFRLEVTVEREGTGHVARLVPNGNSREERRILDPDPACGGLAEALAVAFAVWTGSLAKETPAEPTRAAPDQASDDGPPTETERPPESKPTNAAAKQLSQVDPQEQSPRDEPGPRRPWIFGFEASGVASIGFFAEPAFGLSAGFSVWSSLGIGARARLMRAGALPTDVPPGSVAVGVWASLLSGCGRFAVESRISLLPCLELGVGSQHAEAKALLGENGEADRLWAVLGPSLGALFLISEPFALLATGTAVVRLHDQTYIVDGETVAQQPRFGAYLGLGVVAEWSLPGGRKSTHGDLPAQVGALTTDAHAPR